MPARRSGSGLFNETFFVSYKDQEAVVRIAPPEDEVFCFYERLMMRQEPGLHEMLLAKTSIPVPRIYRADFSHRLIDRDYLIMERLAGRPLSELGGVLTQAQVGQVLFQVGRFLTECHELSSDAFGYVGPHAPMEPQDNWRDAFLIMWTKLLEDVAAAGFYDRDEVKLLRELLVDKLDAFPDLPKASLLHMDVWGQNILCDEEGNVTGLLDWDRALWGDPEIEYAVLDYCGISMPAFWRGYGQTRPSGPDAALRNLFYLLYEIQKYIVIEAGRRNNPDRAATYKTDVLALLREAEVGGTLKVV